jgi:methylmalonyl-CoA mutase N-terminal domain/subunit
MGGAQSIATSSYDEAFCIPADEAATIALRTQQNHRYESGLTQTVDVFAGRTRSSGSTDEMEVDILSQLREIPVARRHRACIEGGYAHRLLADGALTAAKKHRQRRAAHRRAHTALQTGKINPDIPPSRSRPTRPKSSLPSSRRFAKRGQRPVEHALEEIRSAAKNKENVCEAMDRGCLRLCDTGEMCGATAVGVRRVPPPRNLLRTEAILRW